MLFRIGRFMRAGVLLLILWLFMMFQLGGVTFIHTLIVSILTGIIVFIVLLYLYAKGVKEKNRLKGFIMIGFIVVISSFIGYGVFENLMEIDVMILYDSNRGIAILRLDNNTVLLNVRRDEEESFVWEDSVGSKYDTWYISPDVNLNSIGVGKIEINIFGKNIKYKKWKEITIDNMNYKIKRNKIFDLFRKRRLKEVCNGIWMEER